MGMSDGHTFMYVGLCRTTHIALVHSLLLSPALAIFHGYCYSLAQYLVTNTRMHTKMVVTNRLVYLGIMACHHGGLSISSVCATATAISLNVPRWAIEMRLWFKFICIHLP